ICEVSRMMPLLGDEFSDTLWRSRFLLSLEAEGKGPSFNVSAHDDITALMKAAYYPNARPQLAEIMTVLLKHFSRPEQINARSTRQSRTAAVQAAIAATNVAALRALVKA